MQALLAKRKKIKIKALPGLSYIAVSRDQGVKYLSLEEWPGYCKLPGRLSSKAPNLFVILTFPPLQIIGLIARYTKHVHFSIQQLAPVAEEPSLFTTGRTVYHSVDVQSWEAWIY